VIGLPAIVGAVKPVDKQRPAEAAVPGVRGVASILKEAASCGRPAHVAMDSALRKSCAQSVQDAGQVGQIHNLWMKNADRDLSELGHFGERTLNLVLLQELALDSPKTGWRMDPGMLAAFEAPTPHWFSDHRRRRRAPVVEAHSRSALGELRDLPPPHDWAEGVLLRLGPSGEANSLMHAAEERATCCSDDQRAFLLRVWGTAHDLWKREKSACVGLESRQARAMTCREATEKARAHWLREIDGRCLSREAFALVVYRERSGDPDVWELCFHELVQVAAQQNSARIPTESGCGRASVLSVARGAAPVALRPAPGVPGRDSRTTAVFGPAPASDELTHMGKVCRNLARMRGPPDGGELADVPREEARVVPVDEIRYTHDWISTHFKDGRTIASLVEELAAGLADPLQTPELQLDVVQFEGALWSIRNRRLHALKEYQEYLRQQGLATQVQVLAHVICQINGPRAALYKFLECLSTQVEGRFVEVRPSSRAGLPGAQAAHDPGR